MWPQANASTHHAKSDANRDGLTASRGRAARSRRSASSRRTFSTVAQGADRKVILRCWLRPCLSTARMSNPQASARSTTAMLAPVTPASQAMMIIVIRSLFKLNTVHSATLRGGRGPPSAGLARVVRRVGWVVDISCE